MTREEYEEEKIRRRDDPESYPWFMYQMFGWHNMQFLSEKEAKESIKFYHLQKDGDIWMRNGRQPIYMSKRTVTKGAYVGKRKTAIRISSSCGSR